MSAARHGAPRLGLALALALAPALGASVGCNTHKDQYVREGDTGAAAPATKRDLSETKNAPDSTAGVSRRTGQPGVSGDSLGRRKETVNAVKQPGKKP